MGVDEKSVADPALAEFLGAESEDRARERLGELLTGAASPLVWKVIRRQLGSRRGGFDPVELEDLHANTLLKLQLHLISARAGERAAPASFGDYVAVSAFNAVAGFLMARQPERTRLRDRVRYVLRRDRALATWSGPERDAICGREAWRGAAASGDDEPRLGGLVDRHVATTGAGWGQFPKLIAAVLDELGAPCRLESLVDALAERLGVDDAEPVALGHEQESGTGRHRDPADPALDAETRLDWRQRLERVWAEIVDLPSNQRFALLANLRGEAGEDLLDIVMSARVADRGAVAEALGFGAGERDELLASLPREDLWIAERLGLTRQQVINLRKSARLRLARRLRDLALALG